MSDSLEDVTEMEAEDGANGSRAKPAPDTDLKQLLQRVSAQLEALGGDPEDAGRSLKATRNALTHATTTVEKLLEQELEQRARFEDVLKRLESLYARELSYKRRAAVPVLWWRLALTGVLCSVLTVATLLGAVALSP